MSRQPPPRPVCVYEGLGFKASLCGRKDFSALVSTLDIERVTCAHCVQFMRDHGRGIRERAMVVWGVLKP